MDIFRKIEQSLVASSASRSFQRALAGWRNRWPLLATLGGAESIARASREPGPRVMKDAIHVALCVEATQKPKDEPACLFLYWLFLPGLIRTADELCASDAADFDDVSGELLTGFLEAASKVGPFSTHVARHLMRGARLRALTALRKAEARASQEGDLGIEQVGADDPTDAAGLILSDALRQGIVSAMDVELFLTEREDLAAAAFRHELSATAARQVKARARRKLAAWLSETSRNPLAS